MGSVGRRLKLIGCVLVMALVAPPASAIPALARRQRAWVLSGTKADVSPAVPASDGRDSDER